MRIDKTPLNEETKAKIIQMLNDADDKTVAITEAMEMVISETQGALIEQIVREAQRAEQDAEYKKSLGLRPLSENEKKFYEMLKGGAKQAITAAQIDIIPVETIDKTLDDIRTEYPIMNLITFAPANVKHWLTGAKTGGHAWGSLASALANSAELSATLTGLNIEVGKLYTFCVIPKSIRDLEIGYVDRYFRAILQETIYDGIVEGYLSGTGKDAPIGILKQIGTVGQDGTHTAKTVNATLTGFSPKQMAPVLTALSKNGKRAVREIAIIANPVDVYNYINPALYGDSLSGGYITKSFMPVTVYEEPMMPQGTGAITLKGHYTMGFSGMKVQEYTETKALEDADLLIAKVYGNGRADDDNVAYVFNTTKLKEYVPTVTVAAQ